MQRLFLRLYLGIAIAILISSVATVALVGGHLHGNLITKTQKIMRFPAAWAVEQLRAAAPPEAGALSETLGYPVVVVDRDALPAAQQRALAAPEGRVVLSGRGVYMIAPLDAQRAARLGPMYRVEPDRNGILLPGVLVTLLASLAGAGLMMAHLWRQLNALDRAASALGAGDLEARAAVLNRDATGELARSFNQMAQRLSAMVAAQQELLWAVSHDLRTPLTRLRFSLALLEGDTPAAQADRIRSIEADLDRLDQQVGEVLRYARLQGQPLHAEPVDAAALLAHAADAARALRAGLAVERAASAAPVTIHGSEALLRRALENLVSNAVRHARSRLLLQVSARDGWVEIAVEDDGPGIPEAARARVFEPYQRLGAQDEEGSGLGLAIVARIASRHGGTVSAAQSAALGGARLVLRLPAAGALLQTVTL